MVYVHICGDACPYTQSRGQMRASGPHSITSVVEPGAKLAGQQTTMLLTVLYVPKYVWP